MTSQDQHNQHRGEHHLDDRTPLAFVYEGVALVAVGYRNEIVQHWEEATNYTVVRTPEGNDIGDQSEAID